MQWAKYSQESIEVCTLTTEKGTAAAANLNFTSHYLQIDWNSAVAALLSR